MLAGLLMVTLSAASWGTWSLFLRPSGLPPTVTSPIVFLVMALVMLPAALRAPRVTWDRRTVALVLANTAFDALNVITFFGALSTTTVAIATLTHYAAPILVALAAPKIDGTRVPGTLPAAATALAGLVIVLEPWAAPVDGAALGAALGFASAICYAGNVFVVRRLAHRLGPPRAMSYHSLLAALVLAPFALVDLPAAPSPSGLLLVVAGAVTIGAVSGVVFAYGLVRVGSARAAVLTFAEPLVAVAVGAVVWEEPLHLTSALGAVLVLGAGIHVASKAR
ncbi:MAG TPA: DMT family transporter [Kofleriaceae bacterium]|nr:DMT family transporter [Kofleriaceae bacterium]